jgi:hypothetical protein
MLNAAADLASIAAAEDLERRSRISKAWLAYYGQAPVPLKQRRNEQTNDNVRLNYSRLIVDVGVAKLFGSSLAVNAPHGAPDTVQPVIDAFLRANGGGLLWQRLGLSGAIGGTMFYRLGIRDDGTVRVVVLDPQGVEVQWDPDDFERITKWRISWSTMEDGRGISRRQTIQPDGINGWTILDEEAIEGGWRVLGETEWPHVYPPIGQCQNLPSPHEVYGISDLEPDVLGLISSIERVASNINRIVRLYAHPRTWGRMIGDALTLDANPGSVLRLEHPDANLQNLEMTSDLGSSIQLYRELVAGLRETTRIPDVATGKLDSTAPLSGVALQILYAPLLEKIGAKRETYGNCIVEMMRRVLDLHGLGENNICTIVWPELIPADPEAERRTAVIDRQIGVSSKTLMAKLGYDPEAEAEQRNLEDAQAQDAATRSFNAGQTA